MPLTSDSHWAWGFGRFDVGRVGSSGPTAARGRRGTQRCYPTTTATAFFPLAVLYNYIILPAAVDPPGQCGWTVSRYRSITVRLFIALTRILPPSLRGYSAEPLVPNKFPSCLITMYVCLYVRR